MYSKFQIDQQGNGILGRTCTKEKELHIRQKLEAEVFLDLRWITKYPYKKPEINLPYKVFLEGITESAEEANSKEPNYLFPYVVLSEIHSWRGDYKEAFETVLSGIDCALKTIPKDFQGPLATDVEGNEDFFLLVNQFTRLINDNTKANVNLEAVDMNDWIWYGRDLHLDALDQGRDIEDEGVFNEIANSKDKDFQQALRAHIRTLEKLQPYLLKKFPDWLQGIASLYVLAGKTPKAIETLDTAPDDFRTAFVKAAVWFRDEDFAKALFWLRHGMILNRNFIPVNVYNATTNFQSYDDHPTTDEWSAQQFNENWSAILWWMEYDLAEFAYWGMNHSESLIDQAILMGALENHQREGRRGYLDEFVIKDVRERVTLESCSRAIQPVKTLTGVGERELLPFLLR